jgi:hypothetical protein
MIRTAIRTTAGANKNKNATMATHSENGIGECRIVPIIAHQAKPARACHCRILIGSLDSSRLAQRLRIDFGGTGCTNAE